MNALFIINYMSIKLIYKKILGAPGWLSWLSIRLLTLAPDSLLPEHVETMIPLSNPAFWI